MNSFTLKIIALISMLCDHIYCACFFSMPYFFLNCIGRIAFPIFAFQLSQGYIHTRSKSNYILRLLLFAIISQLPFYLFQNSCNLNFGLNIGFTLLLGFLSILAYDKISNSNILFKKGHFGNKVLALFVAFGIACLANILKVDYGMFGILIILCFYIFRNSKIYTLCSVILLTLLRYTKYMLVLSQFIYILILAICTCLSLVFIFMYNKKEGPKCKYLFYAFYPLHLLILSFI